MQDVRSSMVITASPLLVPHTSLLTEGVWPRAVGARARRFLRRLSGKQTHGAEAGLLAFLVDTYFIE